LRWSRDLTFVNTFDKSTGADKIQIIIHNVGMGPLLIKNIEIRDESGLLIDGFAPIYNMLPPNVDWQFADHVGEYLSIGRDKDLAILTFQFSPRSLIVPPGKMLAINELNKLTLRIDCHDIYSRPVQKIDEKIRFAVK
jgi:hypothetical protein